jgi:hypothetical protein
MRPNIDLTDIALVPVREMAVPMQHLIDAGRGMVLMRGASSAELRELDRAVWDDLMDDAAVRVAVLLRFRCLVEVFAAQRLQSLLLQTGYNLIAPALQVAATMRLNAERGFNPLKFERALRSLLAELEQQRAARYPMAA